MSEIKMKPSGGSEIMEAGLRRHVDLEKYNAHIILSKCQENQIIDGKINILWQHLNYNEPLTQGMTNKFFLRAIDAFVYVSHWQHEKFRYVYNAPVENAHIVKNAIEPIRYKPRKKGEKIRLIYTSTPFRGLEILLDAFSLLKRDDIELHVYSSTLIYGSDYNDAFNNQYKPLFDRASNMDGVIYHGYAKNQDVINALCEAHIFSYPSIFEETCCLAMIEAGAAGCRIVAHNIGALAETGTEYADFVPIRINRQNMAEKYASALNSAINQYWDNQNILAEQSAYFNRFYSWERVSKQWKTLLEHYSGLE